MLTPLDRGDLILPVDQLISNVLNQIGDLILVAKFEQLSLSLKKKIKQK